MTADDLPNWRLAKAERFLQAADRAFAADDWETAASRAYYATYHAVAALLESRAGMRRGRWDHVQLQIEFRRRFAAQGFLFSRQDSRQFDKLYKERLAADYERGATRHATALANLRAARDLCVKIRGVMADA